MLARVYACGNAVSTCYNAVSTRLEAAACKVKRATTSFLSSDVGKGALQGVTAATLLELGPMMPCFTTHATLTIGSLLGSAIIEDEKPHDGAIAAVGAGLWIGGLGNFVDPKDAVAFMGAVSVVKTVLPKQDSTRNWSQVATMCGYLVGGVPGAVFSSIFFRILATQHKKNIAADAALASANAAKIQQPATGAPPPADNAAARTFRTRITTIAHNGGTLMSRIVDVAGKK